jgi:acetyltransferase EpsM
MKIAVLGAGTLAEFIIEIAESLSDIRITGLYDDRYPNIATVCSVPVLGTISDLKSAETPHLMIGIGEPSIRKKMFFEKTKAGFLFPSLIHSSCVISPYTVIEDGVIIGPFSTVLSGSKIARGACLLSHVNVNHRVTIGAFALVAAGVVFGNGVTIGEGSHIGLGSVLNPKAIVGDWTYVSNR